MPPPQLNVPPGVWSWLGPDGMVTLNVGFDQDVESRHLATAKREGRQLLSIRLSAHEVLIGPRWVPGETSACAGCAESRLRLRVDHPLLTRSDVNAGPTAGWPATVPLLLDVGLEHIARHRLGPGDMLRLGLTETRRHRVLRSLACPLCADAARNPDRPHSLVLEARPSGDADAVPLRGARSPEASDAALVGLVDRHVGPVLQVMRDNRAPFAMSCAQVPSARAMGYGRGASYERAAPVAILEAYERLGAVPHDGQILQGLCYDDLRGIALDPHTLGRYSRAQLDHPNARVMEYQPDVPMDWAYAHRLDDGEAWLVPADVAFYGYEYRRLGGGDTGGHRRVHFFAESSSGCAVGSSIEEAALHGLMELIERDAFLMAWCRRAPLPAIGGSTIDDPISHLLLDAIDATGFDVHLLATTYDLGLPSVWALGLNRTAGAVPATLSAAGSSPVPAEAVRAALWELAQLVARPVDWDVDAVGAMVEDPSLVDTIEDHVHLYAMPELRHRVTEVLGGPTAPLDSAFPGWPERLCQAARHDVRAALDYLLAGCRRAGLHEALVVDQSTREHRDLGLRVARVIVPGILPMCFGSPQQRLGGLARRRQALEDAGAPVALDEAALLDPHPFP